MNRTRNETSKLNIIKGVRCNEIISSCFIYLKRCPERVYDLYLYLFDLYTCYICCSVCLHIIPGYVLNRNNRKYRKLRFQWTCVCRRYMSVWTRRKFTYLYNVKLNLLVKDGQTQTVIRCSYYIKYRA